MTVRLTVLWVLAASALLLQTSASQGAEPPDMAQSARAFLDALSPPQRKAASRPFTDASRHAWNFLPGARAGLALGTLSDAQRRVAFVFIRSGLSDRGYTRLRGVRTLEGVLRAALGPQRRRASPNWRDPGLYYLAIFGPPGANQPWGWRLEGHHLSLNFTCIPDRPCIATPFFFGANPARVGAGPHRDLRVLAAEEDIARRLVNVLDPAQRRRALLAGRAPGNLFLGTRETVVALEKSGLPAAVMAAAQRELLMKLIEAYVRAMRPAIADAELAEARKAGVGKIHFAWMGGTQPGQDHFYRVHGPTLFIEYSNHGNHIHSVWRDPVDEFGAASLRTLRSTRRSGAR